MLVLGLTAIPLGLVAYISNIFNYIVCLAINNRYGIVIKVSYIDCIGIRVDSNTFRTSAILVIFLTTLFVLPSNNRYGIVIKVGYIDCIGIGVDRNTFRTSTHVILFNYIVCLAINNRYGIVSFICYIDCVGIGVDSNTSRIIAYSNSPGGISVPEIFIITVFVLPLITDTVLLSELAT